ncbi:unnamed protein product [Kluyveromyces dobzhanskii CBS 2104]|uniref:WGS project CCBQ000000000 data, contig 00099 n=1 Tax=Kluyveromyces dobzhanskii CBS 2104 TaxID=1427455 RepID=A0A0A8L3Z4_9SACH|nr:unnamed protein product [Kluyveromyces dobzhanskii CBS 2104]
MGNRHHNKTRTLLVANKGAVPGQDILDLFKVAFSDELYGDEIDEVELREQVQAVKANLYDREYTKAFDSVEKRVAYCCRWSPSRAVAYSSLFASLKPVKNVLQCKHPDDGLDEEDSDSDSDDITQHLSKRLESLDLDPLSMNVLCIGGGAGGELVSFASIFAPSRDYNSQYATDKREKKFSSLNIQVVDIADWSDIVGRIDHTIKSKWLRSQSENFSINFKHADILSMTTSQLNLDKVNLISLLFTTNELFMEDKAKSIRFLQQLNKNCASGTYLLIVESAGSFSHIEVGSKKFPIQFLIDTILQGKRGDEENGCWDLVDMEDSIWYRCDEKFDYKLKLENMRFFYRLYRKK